MNLAAPRARTLICPEGPCRWRSSGHLLRCRSALRAHVRPSTLRAQGNANGDFPTGAPCIWPLLNRLQYHLGGGRRGRLLQSCRSGVTVLTGYNEWFPHGIPERYERTT